MSVLVQVDGFGNPMPRDQDTLLYSEDRIPGGRPWFFISRSARREAAWFCCNKAIRDDVRNGTNG